MKSPLFSPFNKGGKIKKGDLKGER